MSYLPEYVKDGYLTLLYPITMTDERRLQVQYLLTKYIDGKSSGPEEDTLFQLLEQDQDEEWLEILEELMAVEEEDASYVSADWQDVREKIFAARKAGKVRRMPGYLRWVAAACVVFLVFGFWFLVVKKSEVGSRKSDVAITTDVPAPMVTRAMITLADGRMVPVDSLTTIDQGGVRLAKNEHGEIEYSSKFPVQSREIQYNTINNPRGSKVVSMTLSDGTKVWLNAESSLRYPVAFVGDSRRVEVTGEAYFEVSTKYEIRNTKDEVRGTKKTPFMVDANGIVTEVLGTHFNVNAYLDEGETRVTLLEGKVRVVLRKAQGDRQAQGDKAVVIKPGQQVKSIGNGQLAISKDVDTEEVMAWKNGYFSFKDADLRTILRQAERWYDVDVEFEGSVPKVQFTGEIGRTLTLKQFLSVLEETRIKYRIDKRRLIITN